MSLKYYKLNDKYEVVTVSMEEAFTSNRNIAKTSFKEGIWISTVLLPIDHSFSSLMSEMEMDTPVVFETLIQHKNDNTFEEMYRYRTYDEALEGHKNAVKEYLSKGMTISSHKIVMDKYGDLSNAEAIEEWLAN